jgi:translation initiation factor IF-3
VRLVDSETGALQPPQSLKSIIASIEDPRAFHVELVTDNPSPIVKIIDTKAALLKFKEQKKHDREVARAQAHKEVQLTWGVASGDLAHKLNKVRQELVKGRRVDLIFAPKKGQILPTKQGIEVRLKETMDSLADVGKEYLPREERKNIVALYLKPSQPPS